MSRVDEIRWVCRLKGGDEITDLGPREFTAMLPVRELALKK